jgi:Tfp pilus assembly protein PilV
MIELLVTATILAVGILGLTLLQAMAIRGARGGRSLSTAVQVGEAVLDRIEQEGRLSWLNLTDSPYTTPGTLSTLKFVTLANTETLAKDLTFTVKGQVPNAEATDPKDQLPFYKVNMVRMEKSAAATGKLSDFTVTVTFADEAQASGQAAPVAINRTVKLTRRILHG